jgi:hypothetical protein
MSCQPFNLNTLNLWLVQKPTLPALITTTLDAAADPEGYYQIILGEHLDSGRYQVFSSVGKGMFANVVRARVLQNETGDVGKEVAIKIIRSQESMFVASRHHLLFNMLMTSQVQGRTKRSTDFEQT